MSSHGDVRRVGDGRLSGSASDTGSITTRDGDCDGDGDIIMKRSLRELAQRACATMEKNDTSELYTVLNLSMSDGESKEGVEDKAACNGSIMPPDDADGTGNITRCNELLTIFYSLIGHSCIDEGFDGTTIKQTDIPLSIKAHLLLRALLRIPNDGHSISW